MSALPLPARIVTERLILRKLRPDDAESLYLVFGDERSMQYWSNGPLESLEDTRAYIAGNMPDGDRPTLGITLASAGEEAPAIGWVALWEARAGKAEIGYILRRDFGRQGYAREAVSAVIAYAFGSLAMRKIGADVDPDNALSLRLLESLGFKREGLLRAEWDTHIGIRDSVLLGLLADNWHASSGTSDFAAQ